MSDSPRLPYTVSNKHHDYVDYCYIVDKKVDIKHVSRHLNKSKYSQ